MAADIPTVEPDVITAGDTIKWTITLSDYKASDGWELSYAFVSPEKQFSITSSADGDDHAVSVAATTTANYWPGVYRWQSYVTKAAERYKILEGRLEVKPNYAVKTTGLDDRSHVQIVYEALKAMLENKATNDQIAYTMRTFSVSRYTPEQVLAWYNQYKYYYEQEKAAENISQGLASGTKINIRL